MRIFKRYLILLLRRFGFGLWKIDSTEVLNFENLLYALFQRFAKVTFLHIGAHDGKSFSDPLYHFVTRNPSRVSGVMFEPVKEVYEKLVSNLGHIGSIRLVNMAVHPSEKQVTIYKYSQLKGALRFEASGRSTIIPERLNSREFGGTAAALKQEVVPATNIYDSLQWLPDFDEYGLHVICIDSEGLDFDLLDSIEFQTVRPQLIRFEHNLCQSKERSYTDRYSSILRRLNDEGYQVFTELNDAVAIASEMIPLLVQLRNR
jgi:FkbM family methyltransferase